MREQIILILFLFFGFSGFSQDPITLDPRQIESVPGEILIKLKDEVEPGINIQNGIIQSYDSVTVLDRIGLKGKVLSSKILFSIKTRKYKTPKYQTGTVSKDKYNLNNLMKVKLKEEFFMEKEKLIEELNNNKEVEYAEPNYIFSIVNVTPVTDVMSEEEAKSWIEENYEGIDEEGITPNDALYSSQSNITSTNIHKVWETTKGDTTSVIAILDTGVDTDHPDLKDNIWTNHTERLGVSEYDDDENGFDDDIHGWDFIHDDNDPKDDNMHGTHVAGIAAAVGDNEIGIAGASWYSKIMPIKILNVNGKGNSDDIAQGIEYAYQNGATILNMSFGSYNESITMKLALSNAYAYAYLVAAAGNDEVKIGACAYCRPMFPAAYTFVLGVESPTVWSNYDQDGPLFSNYDNLYNYEVPAPGASIMSTIPNGGYRALSGTSMAAPLVAGSLALYNIIKSPQNKEVLFGDYINSRSDDLSNYNRSDYVFDLNKIINSTPVPILKIYNIRSDDSDESNEVNDGLADAGETIKLFASARNWWAPSDSIKLKIKLAGNEFQNAYYKSKVDLIDSTANLGKLGNYAYNTNTSDPFILKLKDDIPHDTDIEFYIYVWDKNRPEDLDSTYYKLRVTNQKKLRGPFLSDTTISAGKYIVQESVIIDGAKVTFKPGVVLNFENYGYFATVNDGKYEAIGNKDSLVTFNRISGSTLPLYFEKCHFCLFQENDGGIQIRKGDIKYSIIDANNHIYGGDLSFSNSYSHDPKGSYNNIIGGYIWPYVKGYNSNFIVSHDRKFGSSYDRYYSFIKSARSYQNITYYMDDIFLNVFPNRQGDKEMIDDIIIGDFRDGTDYINDDVLYIDSLRKKPYSEAPGMVWNLEINEKYAHYIPKPYTQWGIFKVPTYDPNIFYTEPAGVGTYKFKVFFNRPMNTSINPQITYGTREPYNQSIITENGEWSEDSLTYTVNHYIGANSFDGINRIMISEAQDMLNFEIPETDVYHFNIQAAGSLSSEFQATPGLGKISLEWKGEELTDHLGYNMYRYKALTESTYSSVEKINTSLITDSTYVDYDVEPGSKYFYKYTMLRTNFTETDTSKTVSTTPLTADLGDANGDFEVDILDVIHQINYILGSSPQPFIMDAADVNNDGAVNVLDVVGTVNIIMNPIGGGSITPGEVNYIPTEPVGEAELFWRGDTLFVDSPIPLAGLQLSFDYDLDYTLLDAVKGFESMGYAQDEEKVLMLYSLSGKKLASGITPILTKAEPGEVHVTKAVFSNIEGRSVTANYMGYVLEEIAAKQQSSTIFSVGYPNPTSGRYILEYHIPEQVDGVGLVIYDMSGKVIHADGGLKNTSGRHRVEIDLSTKENGVYIAVLSIGNKGYLLKQDVKRIVKE